MALGTSVSQQRRPTETTPSSSSSPSTVSVIQPETAALVARNTLLMLYQSSSASSDSAVSSSSNNNTQPLLSNNEGIACANRAFHLLQRAVSSSSKPSSTTSIDGKGGSSPQASLTPRFESLHHIAQTAHVLGYGALGRWDRIDKIIMYHNRPPVKSSSPSSHQESIVGSLLVTCSLIQTLLHHHNTTKASGTSSSSATYNTAHRVDALHVIKLQLYPRLRLDLTRIDWSCSAAVTNILDDSFALDLVSTAISSIFKIESALYYHSLQAFPATHFDVNGSRINIGTVQHPLAPPSPAANNEEELALIKCREDLLAAVHSHQRSRQVKSMATSSPSSSSSSILQTKLLDVIDLATLSGLVEILETRAKPANMYTYPVFDKTSRREKLQRRKGLHDMVELVFGSLSCRHPSFLDPFEAISIRCDRSNNSSTSSNASSSAFKTALLAPNTSLAQLGQLPHLVIRYMVEHFIDTPYRQISDTYVFLRQVMYKVVDDFRSQGFVMTAQTYHFLMRGANRVYTVDRRMDVNHLPNKIHPSIAVSLESSSSLPSSSSSSPKPTSSLSSSSPTIYHEYTFQESLSLRKQKYYTFLTLLNWMRRSDIQPTAETFAHGFQSTISHVPEYRRVTADYGFRLFGRRNVVMHMEILMSSARFNKLSHNRASLISLIQAYSANGEFECEF